jgi:hypothetical protein
MEGQHIRGRRFSSSSQTLEVPPAPLPGFSLPQSTDNEHESRSEPGSSGTDK